MRDYNKLLFHRENVGGLEVHQLVLFICKRQEALHLAHDTLWGGHLGSRKCTQRLRLSFWWPNMTTDVKKYCGTCAQCQLRARETVYDNTPIKTVITPFNTWEIVNCDLIGPFEEKSSAGHSYVLVLIDQCSRWVEATAKATCDVLLEILARTGIPKVIVSDNGTNFTSNLSVDFRNRMGCSPRFSTPGHPEGNSLVERHNVVVKHMLHHVIKAGQEKLAPSIANSLLGYERSSESNLRFITFSNCLWKTRAWATEYFKRNLGRRVICASRFWKIGALYMQKLKQRLEMANKLAIEDIEQEQTRYVNRYNLRAM